MQLLLALGGSPNNAQAFQRKQWVDRSNFRQSRGNQLAIPTCRHDRQPVSAQFLLEFLNELTNKSAIAVYSPYQHRFFGALADEAFGFTNLYTRQQRGFLVQIF